MPDRIDQAARALLQGGSSALIGSWSYDLDQDRWSWSPEVYAFFGFAPGEVVPTSELLLAHKDDSVHSAEPVDVSAFVAGELFSSHLKVRDAHNRARSVLVIGRAVLDHGPRVVRGHLVDLSPWRRASNEHDVRDGIEGATEHRATIEQAKGALMALHGVTEDEAFALLVKESQNQNTKLRDVADQLVRSLPSD